MKLPHMLIWCFTAVSAASAAYTVWCAYETHQYAAIARSYAPGR